MPNFRLDGVKTLECTKVHKDQEEKERKAELDGLKKEIQELRNDPKSNPEEITEKVSRAQKIAASRVDAKIFYGSDGRSNLFVAVLGTKSFLQLVRIMTTVVPSKKSQWKTF